MQGSSESVSATKPSAGSRILLRVARRSVRRTGATIIYEALHQAIATMVLRPGEPIQEKALAQQFSVSRTPVREALLHLSRDGLVDLIPQSGTFVSRIAIGAIHEAAVIRRALEAVTVTRTAEISGAAELARLDMVLARQRLSDEIGNTVDFHEADEAFHETIALIAGYATIWQVVRQNKVQVDRVRRLTLPVAGRMKQVIQEHLHIRDAIAAHDAAAAVAALDYHLNMIVPDVDRLSTQYPEYFFGRPEECASLDRDASVDGR